MNYISSFLASIILIIGLSFFTPNQTIAQCTIPENIEVFTIGSSTTLVVWTTVPEALAYTIAYTVAGTTNWQFVPTSTATFGNINGLLNNTNYEFRIQVTCPNETLESPSIEQLIQYSETCVPPQNILTTITANNEVLITWDAVSIADQYAVSTDIDGVVDVSIISDTWLTVPYVSNGDYTIEITALCGSESSTPSIYMTSPFLDNTCPAPTNITLIDSSPTSLDIQWDGDMFEFTYLITVENLSTGELEIIEVTTDFYQATIDGLDPNTDYEITIQTLCGNGIISTPTDDIFVTGDVQAVCADLDKIDLNNSGSGHNKRLFDNDLYEDANNIQYTSFTKIIDQVSLTKIIAPNGQITFADANNSVTTNLQHGQLTLFPNQNTTKGQVQYTPDANTPTTYDYFEYEVKYDDGTTILTDTAKVLICPQNINCDISIIVKVQLKILLEGPYDSNTGQMTNNLTSVLPNYAPYSIPPWQLTYEFYKNTSSSDITDWLIVQLMDTNFQTVASSVGLLAQNGEVKDLNGMAGVTFYGVDPNTNYHITIRHRNHLDIISASPLAVNNTVPYDFTQIGNVLAGNTQLKELDSGVYGLHAGDMNGDGVISVVDFNVFNNNLSNIGYYSGDCTMDSNVSISDFNAYRPNASIIGIPQIRY